jgi:hypothetical protein
MHTDNAYSIGKKREVEGIDPRQQFDIPVQAALVKVIS